MGPGRGGGLGPDPGPGARARGPGPGPEPEGRGRDFLNNLDQRKIQGQVYDFRDKYFFSGE